MGHELFNASVESFDYNVVTKSVTIAVRETAECKLMPFIHCLPEMTGMTLMWEAMERAGGEGIAPMFFHGLKLDDHRFSQSYMEPNGCAKHILQFTYEKVDTD